MPSQTLSPAVITEIRRLGGQIAEEPQELDLRNVEVPEPIRQFLADIIWPENTTYSNPGDTLIHVWKATLDSAHLFEQSDFEDIGLDMEYLEEDGMNMCSWSDKFDDTMVMIGKADRGNYLLMIDLEDDDPTDPQIYRFDQYDQEQFFDDLEGMPLSEFLRSLQPDSQ
jgi:hypothetical protein